MSTHATLGVRFPDGRITGCYVHYDGGTLRPRIENFIDEKTMTGLVLLITKAQGVGGIRSFNCLPYNEPDGERKTDLLDDDRSYIITEKNWGEYHMGASYTYLVDYESECITSRNKYG